MDDTPRPLLEHVLEVRQRLLRCLAIFFISFFCCYYFVEEIFNFLLKPLADALKYSHLPSHRIICTGITEGFLSYIKLSTYTALGITTPFILLQTWLFIEPALYRKERLFLRFLFISTPLFFVAGACFTYYFVMPNAYSFFLNFEKTGKKLLLPMQLEAKMNEYIAFTMKIIIAFGICFEMPILLIILSVLGKISAHTLKSKWRFAVLFITIISAIITPPDVISMLFLVMPMVFLYFLSWLIIWLLEKRIVFINKS